jgi:hypothetical protein
MSRQYLSYVRQRLVSPKIPLYADLKPLAVPTEAARAHRASEPLFFEGSAYRRALAFLALQVGRSVCFGGTLDARLISTLQLIG